MERYLGIDPHRDSCTLALVSPRGKKVRQMVVPTEGSELVKTVRDLRGPLHVCVEEGEWISEILTPWVARWWSVGPRSVEVRRAMPATLASSRSVCGPIVQGLRSTSPQWSGLVCGRRCAWSRS